MEQASKAIQHVRWFVHAPPGIFDPLREGDPDRVGGYRLHARLGSGGMGEVFLSLTDPAQPIAVKIVRRDFADDVQFRARFVREVRSARLVDGPHIAQLVDADPYADTPWLATAYVPGPTLAEAVELYSSLPVPSVITLMAGIAEALETIHAAGLVHRDLKPANVILGADGLRVIDFGVARATDATALTLTGNLVGSPQYVAPEQILGTETTPAGDVFSLGALAYFAATGRPAFGEGPRVSVVYRVVNGEPDLTGCPIQLRALIASCLAKDPAGRPTTAEIAEACKPDAPPQTAADWLPPPVVFAIDAYATALTDLAASLPPSKSGPHGRRRVPHSTSLLHPSSALPRRPSRRVALTAAATLALVGAGTGATLAITAADRPATSTSTSAIGQLPATNTTPPHPGQPQNFTAARSSTSPSSTSSPTSAAFPPGTRPAPPGGSGAPGPGAPLGALPPPTIVTWRGTIHVTTAGLWLDGTPPLAGEGDHRGDVHEAQPAPNAELSSSNPQIMNLALWTEPGTPTGAQCWALATRNGVSDISIAPGTTLCALTADGQAAVLKVDSVPTDASASGPGVTCSATVWGRPS